MTVKGGACHPASPQTISVVIPGRDKVASPKSINRSRSLLDSGLPRFVRAPE